MMFFVHLFSCSLYLACGWHDNRDGLYLEQRERLLCELTSSKGTGARV